LSRRLQESQPSLQGANGAATACARRAGFLAGVEEISRIGRG